MKLPAKKHKKLKSKEWNIILNVKKFNTKTLREVQSGFQVKLLELRAYPYHHSVPPNDFHFTAVTEPVIHLNKCPIT